MEKPETKFRRTFVLPFLKQLNHCFFESIQQVGINGSPDLILGIRGKLVLLELKAESGKLSSLQAYKLLDAYQKGNLVFVARPQNWEIIKALLTKLDKGENLNGTEASINYDEIRGRIKL